MRSLLDGRRLYCARLIAVVLCLGAVANRCEAQRWPTDDPTNPVPTPGSGPITKPEVTWLASPNFNYRNVAQIDSIVLHTTEVGLSGTLDIFQSTASQVSAHFVIAPNGEIYEMVDVADRAWHATYYNSRSVGIEMVGYAGRSSTWNSDNLGALTDLLAWLVQEFPKIPLVHPTGDAYDYPGDTYDEPGIVAHGQVQPWNRTDPGPYFPWDEMLASVAARLDAVPEPSSFLIALAGSAATLVRRRRPATAERQ